MFCTETEAWHEPDHNDTKFLNLSLKSSFYFCEKDKGTPQTINKNEHLEGTPLLDNNHKAELTNN